MMPDIQIENLTLNENYTYFIRKTNKISEFEIVINYA